MIYMGIDPGSRSGAYADIRDGRAEVFPWDDVFFVQHMTALVASGEKIVAKAELTHWFSRSPARIYWSSEGGSFALSHAIVKH